jgi:Uma2 family endonuclease
MELVRTETGMALEDFIRAYAEQPFEWMDGERRPLMPNVAGHGEIIEILYLALYNFFLTHPLGKVIRELPFVLSYTPNWVTGSRVPDLMVFAADRLEAYKAANPDWRQKPYILVPDLVIEVASPNDDLTDLDDKIIRYLMDGVAMAWLVNPLRKQVTVSVFSARAPFSRQQTVLQEGDLLTGGSLLPGFELAITELFNHAQS